MLPFLMPLLTTLAGNGLNILAGAITAKGKDVVEDVLGIKIPDDAAKLTPELISQLKIKEMEHEEKLIELSLEEAKIELEANKDSNLAVTDRWKADMSSDSWLSKNIRPLVLVYLLSAYTVFSLMSAANLDINQAYVELLAQWGMLVMSAYFVGRTVEKTIAIRKDK